MKISLLSLFFEYDFRMITVSLRASNLIRQKVKGSTIDLNLGI